MKKFTKILAFALAVCLMIAGLAACDDGSGETTTVDVTSVTLNKSARQQGLQRSNPSVRYNRGNRLHN